MRYPDFSKKPNLLNFDDLVFKYYVYLEVKDEPGVLALISKIFADQSIGFDKVIQKDQLGNGNVPVVIFTDPIVENEMQTALKDLKNNPVILSSKIIRIEDL
jgi:predicted regulator of amino acid metabolism with ACT domain